MVGDYYVVDLHIHTPASSDYKGPKTEEEYIKILESAKENKVDIIGITDHFTVTGFCKLMSIKEERFSLLQTLRKRSDVESALLSKIQEEVDLFNAIHILMGIEIKLNPGIHYIVIFKENLTVKEVEDFLMSISNGDYEHHKCSEEYMLNLNTKDFLDSLEKVFGDNCFIYGPHCDSQSGLIEGLKNFKTGRMNILKDNRLICLGFNKDGSREYINGSLVPQILKDRGSAIGLIQESDYHGRAGEKVGSSHFLIEKKHGKSCYLTVLSKLLSGEEIITTIDTARQRYDDVVAKKIIFKLGILSKEADIDVEKFCREVCASLNSNKGIFEFKVQVPAEMDTIQKINEIIDIIIDIVEKNINFKTSMVQYSIFPMSRDIPTVVMIIGESSRLHLYKGECYLLSNAGEVGVASAGDIESIVSRKIHARFGIIKDGIADEITKGSQKIKNCLLDFSITYKIDSKISSISCFKVSALPITKFSDEIKEIVTKSNGVTDSGVVYLSRDMIKDVNAGRYSYCYLRVTAPMYNEENSLSVKSFNEVEGGSMLITYNGGCHLATKSLRLLSEVPCYKLVINDESISPQLLIAWLKSSFLQWYICKVYDFDDVFNLLANNKKKIPFLNCLTEEIKGKLVKNIDMIIRREVEFLDKCNKCNLDEQEYIAEVDSHNKVCNDLMLAIDAEIFMCIGLDDDDIDVIYRDLGNMGIYSYKSMNES